MYSLSSLTDLPAIAQNARGSLPVQNLEMRLLVREHSGCSDVFRHEQRGGSLQIYNQPVHHAAKIHLAFLGKRWTPLYPF
jgi:hypothetical protein